MGNFFASMHGGFRRPLPLCRCRRAAAALFVSSFSSFPVSFKSFLLGLVSLVPLARACYRRIVPALNAAAELFSCAGFCKKIIRGGLRSTLAAAAAKTGRRAGNGGGERAADLTIRRVLSGKIRRAGKVQDADDGRRGLAGAGGGRIFAEGI